MTVQGTSVLRSIYQHLILLPNFAGPLTLSDLKLELKVLFDLED